MPRCFRRSLALAHVWAVALLVAALAIFPAAAAYAQTADGTNTLPTGIFENSGRFRVPPSPIVLIGQDTVTHQPCILGYDANCSIGAGIGGGGTLGATVNWAQGSPVADGTANQVLSLTKWLGMRVQLTGNGKDYTFDDTTASDQTLSATLNATYEFPFVDGAATIRGYVSGVAGGAQFTTQATNNYSSASPVWGQIPYYVNSQPVSTGIISADGNFELCIPARSRTRLLTSTGGSGTPKVSYTISPAQSCAVLAGSLPPGENHVGEVGGNQITVAVAQTVTASSAYASGNAIGGLMTIAGAARVSATAGSPGTSGMLESVVVNMKSAQTTQIDVFVFNANPTGSTCADKTAFSIAAADWNKVIAIASIPATTNWFSGGTPSVGQVLNLAKPYVLNNSTSLFACAVTRATPTYASTSDPSFQFDLLRN